jgi:hypothetical protein
MRSPVLLERLVTREDRTQPAEPVVVAELPDGGTWPIADSRFGDWVSRRQVRRLAAGLLVIAGVLGIVSVFVRELGELDVVDRVFPFTVNPVAGVAAVLTGCALLGLARLVRLGRRRAWLASITLLVVAAAAHLLKGGHVEEAAVGLLLAGWLLLERRHFRVSPPGVRRFVGTVATLVLFAVALAAGLGIAVDGDESLVRPAIALVVGLVVLVVALIGHLRSTHAGTPEEREAASAIVDRHGTGPFDELVLADGNRWLFSGDAVVAYTVHGTTMTVWPDPVGPPEAHADAWADAMDHADTYNWSIAIRDAAETWLPIYQAAGLVDTYVDDDLVIPVDIVEDDAVGFADAASAAARPQGFELTVDGAEGAERMTATAKDGSGRMLAFHYVWSPAVDGWLLVHRDDHRAGNSGLADAVVLETLRWMRSHRGQALAISPMTRKGSRPDTARWARLPGVVAHARYEVDDATHAGPGRHRGFGRSAGPAPPQAKVSGSSDLRRATYARSSSSTASSIGGGS